jgi:GNAT superfamily N-acetyltransferase
VSRPLGPRLPAELHIRSLTTCDVKDAVTLANSVALRGSNNISEGFLVSGYHEKVYQSACEHTSSTDLKPPAILLGAHDFASRLVGFIFGYEAAYGREFMGRQTEATIDEHFGSNAAYYILKQIAVEAAWRRRGVGQALADAFLDRVSSASAVFLTIVSEPANPVSESFHAKLGFRPILRSISYGPGGETYPAQIWQRRAIV